MKTFLYPLLLSILVVIAHADAIIVEVDSVTCSNISVKINATSEQFTSLPQDLQVSVNNQIHTAPLPNRSTADLPEKGTNVQMATTLQFDSPFLLSNGYYNMSINLITSEATQSVVASDNIPSIQFTGCSTTASSVSHSTIPYYTAIGVPTHGVIITPPGTDGSSDSGLSSGTKIGITVGILGAALLVILGTMALLMRRWKQKQQLSTGSKPSKYVDGKWINEDRNSAELREISQSQA